MSFDAKIFEGDIQISATNDIAIVEDGDKLVQDVLKIVQTQIGGNPFFPWYGSPISSALIGSSMTTQFISNVAQSQLQTTLNNLKQLQEAQLREFGQNITPQEQIAAIKNISVQRNAIDPRYFSILISILSKARRTEDIELEIDQSL